MPTEPKDPKWPKQPEPMHDPPSPPLRDPPDKPMHDPAGDPTYEPQQPFGDPTPTPTRPSPQNPEVNAGEVPNSILVATRVAAHSRRRRVLKLRGSRARESGLGLKRQNWWELLLLWFDDGL